MELEAAILTKIRKASLDDKLALADLLSRELEAHHKHLSQDALNLVIEQRICSTRTVRLTQRQRQVLIFFSQGLSCKQIAERIDVQSPKTVENHLDAIRRKLSVTSRRECIRRALELRLI
jgi:DNA-binding NarL/FixJ family response regulator